MTVYRIEIYRWTKPRRWRAAVHGTDGSQWEGPLCRSKREATDLAEFHVHEQKALAK